MARLIDVFDKVIDCDYRNERYSVRDNGGIMRHAKEGKKPRKLDGVWTFGVLDTQKGYTRIGNEAVHQIVATAFCGNPPTPQHVVDHIDTNRQNNRPDNLRWVTRLENVMINEITRNKLEKVCGCSIEEIVSNWSIIQDKNLPPNIAWMKAVTKEEAEKSLIAWKKWSESATNRKENDKVTMQYFKYKNGPNAMIYPLEPIGGELSLEEYYNNLKINKRFCYKTYKSGKIGYRVLDYCYNKNTEILTVATQCENKEGVKTLFLTNITLANNEYEYSTRSFFSPDGLEKYFTLAKGEEWTGGDVIDDYC